MISRAEANQPPTPLQLPWSPKLKQDLRQLRERLEEAGEYLVSRLLEEWKVLHPGRKDSVDNFFSRLDDLNINPPRRDCILKKFKKSPIALAPPAEVKLEPERSQNQTFRGRN